MHITVKPADAEEHMRALSHHEIMTSAIFLVLDDANRNAEPAQEPASDNVNHPQHYTQGDIECIDAIKAATAGLSGFEAYLSGTMLKYNWRWPHKNGIEDLQKMIWYANRLIEELKKKSQ